MSNSEEGSESENSIELIESEDDKPAMPNFLEELKGENPKIWGFDYYHVIYFSAAALFTIMVFLYIVIPDPEIRKMVLI